MTDCKHPRQREYLIERMGVDEMKVYANKCDYYQGEHKTRCMKKARTETQHCYEIRQSSQHPKSDAYIYLTEFVLR